MHADLAISNEALPGIRRSMYAPCIDSIWDDAFHGIFHSLKNLDAELTFKVHW